MFQRDNLTLYNKESLTAAQTALSVRLNTADVSKVLYLSADAQILNFECGKGEILLSGRCNYKLLVVSADNVVSGLNYNADFADRIVDSRVTPNTSVMLCTDILDNSYTVGENSINISTLVNTSTVAFVSNEISPVNNVEGSCERFVSTDICTYADFDKLNSTLSIELEVSNGVARVLLSDAYLDFTQTTLADDVLTISGKGGVNLVYVSSNGDIMFETPKFDFVQDIQVKNADNTLVYCPKVIGTKIHVNIAEEEENTLLSAEISYTLQAVNYQIKQVDILTDLYSTQHKLALTTQEAFTVKPLGKKEFDLDLSENLPQNYDELLGIVGAKTEIIKVVARGDSLEIDGLLTATAIYNQDGYSSAYFELPFTRVLECDFPQSADVVAYAYPNSTTVKTDRQGILLSIGVKICAVAFENSSFKYISDVTQEHEIDRNCAFEICIAKQGDDLWTIAKNLNMTENDITDTNPNLNFPLEKDTQIVVYHKI